MPCCQEILAANSGSAWAGLNAPLGTRSSTTPTSSSSSFSLVISNTGWIETATAFYASLIAGMSLAGRRCGFCYNGGMPDRIRIIKHEAVPQCGSVEVRFPDDRPSQYFYWDDIPACRMRPETLDRKAALEKAKAAARAAQITK